jgi:hypothetical protein
MLIFLSNFFETPIQISVIKLRLRDSNICYERNHSSKIPTCPKQSNLISINESYLTKQSRSPSRLDLLTDADCKFEFRFDKQEIVELVVQLRLPDVIILSNGSRYNSLEALCIMLRRLAYPSRLLDLRNIFGREKSMLSRVFNAAIKSIYQRFKHLLLWDHYRMDQQTLQRYAFSIHNKGAPLDNCICFIDGTVRQICRPGENQKVIYNGHKVTDLLTLYSGNML